MSKRIQYTIPPAEVYRRLKEGESWAVIASELGCSTFAVKGYLARNDFDIHDIGAQPKVFREDLAMKGFYARSQELLCKRLIP